MSQVKDRTGNNNNSPSALDEAVARAERAEKELEDLKAKANSGAEQPSLPALSEDTELAAPSVVPETDGMDELRKDTMMAHLVDSLNAGKDIGHYGRLVFAMIARHFMPEAEVIEWLTKDRDFSEEDAALMLRQVAERDYSPPRKERILQWQGEQSFPILPNPDDPDCGNVYRTLKFPEEVYEHIQGYHVEKMEAAN